MGTVSTKEAQRFYDRLGRWHDLAELYERHAKARALALMSIGQGMHVLNVGVGTGRDHAEIVRAVGDPSLAVAFDVSPVMLRLVRRRTAPVVRGDVLRLPFADGSFERIHCAYVLDLIPDPDLPVVLGELKRVLARDGLAVTVSLTEGRSPVSRLVIRAGVISTHSIRSCSAAAGLWTWFPG